MYTRLHDREIRRDAQQLERTFDRTGRNLGDNLSAGIDRAAPKVEKSLQRVEKATDKVADAMGNVSREQANYDALVSRGDAPREKLISQSVRLERAKRAERSAVREAARAHQDHMRVASDAAEAMGDLTVAATGAARSASDLTGALSGLAKGATAGAVLGGLVGVGMGVADMLIDVGKAVVTATQSLWLLPAAVTAAGVGFAALKIGTLGFADAIESIRDPEKFATALQSLSPNAQQAALSIQQLLPQFDALKNGVQDSLFANVAGEIERLSNQFLPMLQSSLSGVASAFNTAFQGVAGVLSSNPEMISNVLNNVQAAFQNASAAAAPFTEALLRITEVGSSFLPQLGTAIADAATEFSAFISNAAETGQLQTWIEDGIAAVKELGDTVFGIGKVIYDTFGSSKPGEFKDSLDAVITAAEGVAWTINKIQSAWDLFARAAQTGVNTAITAVNALLSPLRTTIQLLNALPGVDIAVPDLPHLSPVGVPVAGTPVAAPGAGGIGGAATGARAGAGLGPATPWSMLAVPAPPPDKAGRGGPKLPDAPVVPYDTTVPGGSNPATFAAETSLLDARQKLAEKRARLDQLEKSSAATEQDRLKARNEVIEAERDFQGAEIRLNEARTSQYEKMIKSGDRYANQMGEIGAQLDQDFGISKGLVGIAENITKFVANLAAAPLLGQLDAISQANPSKGGYGAMGIMAAQGAFGPQHTGIDYSKQGYGGASGMGPAALRPGSSGGQPYGLPGGTNTGGYGSSGAVFPPWVHALEQTFGVKASTYPGHQEGDRHESGYAPNPSGENRGIDWSGPVDAMQRFADYLSQVPGSLEQVIWQNPSTGSATEIAGGRPQPGYFSGDLGGHQNHVHTRQSAAIPLPGMAQGYQSAYAPSAPAYTPATPSLAGVPSMPGGPLSGGMPQSAPFTQQQYGGITPDTGYGKGGVGLSDGAMGAALTAAGGLDMLAPGAGQAAQTGMKLANRAIQYGGQVAGIGAQGLMETFLPTGGSELANNNWLTRIVGGLAGAAPAIPNMAGKSAAPSPEQVANVDPNTTQHGQGSSPGPGNTYNVQIDAANREPQGIAKDFEYHTTNANTGPGM